MTWRRKAMSALNHDCIKHLLVSVSSFKPFFHAEKKEDTHPSLLHLQKWKVPSLMQERKCFLHEKDSWNKSHLWAMYLIYRSEGVSVSLSSIKEGIISLVNWLLLVKCEGVWAASFLESCLGIRCLAWVSYVAALLLLSEALRWADHWSNETCCLTDEIERHVHC